MPIVGSYGVAASYERGTPVIDKRLQERGTGSKKEVGMTTEGPCVVAGRAVGRGRPTVEGVRRVCGGCEEGVWRV